MSIINLRRGDALVLRVTFTQDGVQYDMSGWSLAASMKYSNCTPVDLETEWIVGFDNVGRLRLSAEETQGLELGEYELSVRATSPDGDPISTTPVKIVVRD